MANNFHEDDLIKMCIDLLSQLISPAKKTVSENSQSTHFDDVILSNLNDVRNSFTFKNLKFEDGLEFSWVINDTRSRTRWHFVCTCFLLLKTVRNTLENTRDEKVKLLSISQKKVLENSFQFIVPLAILPYLLPGVGISPESKCKHINALSSENLKDFAKYRRLCFVIDSILFLKENDTFHEIITSKYLEDVLAALFQLAFVPMKKPTSEDTSFKGFEYVDDDFEIKEMSFTLWNKLQSNKNKYKNKLIEIQKQTYRPLLIRKYLVLLDAKKTARWMKQNVSKMLTSIILEDDGVVALIRAVVEVDMNSPVQWTYCDVVARLISNTVLNLNDDDSKLLVSQILKILRASRKQQYELVYIQVISLAIKEMFSTDSKATMEKVLNSVFEPLKRIHQSKEEQISASVEKLYNLCVLPTNTSAAVPIDVILPVVSTLFKIYCKVKDSVSHLKSTVGELLGKFILDAKKDNLIVAFNCLIFNEVQEDIVQVDENVKFIFSAHGGVTVIEDKQSENSVIENGVLILDLIKNLQDNDRSVNTLFTYLLEKFITLNSESQGEKRLISILLLTDLSQNQTTLKQILKNSENIIQFIKDLLVTNSQLEMNREIVCVCLTFLTMVLYDLKKKKNVNWKPLDELRPPLEILKKSSSSEVKILADEVYNLILTRSVIGSTEGSDEKKLIEEIPSACEEAIENACDNLLPVRAHGIMELISLLNKKNVETWAKVDKILCLFQENLKDKDSYIYLRAIEGISTIAPSKPDLISILCEEFTSCENSETQLKLGEILKRTVISLRDFVPNYKHLLVNCFLNGAKSADHLVRASSLSILGDVCLMLKFNTEGVIHEILYCARSIALGDLHPEPRRAGVFLISTILRGLETYMFKALQPVLLDLYKMLQKLRSNEDEQTRIHAIASLDILNENTKQFLNPKPIFEKKIHVLDPF